MHRGVMSIAVLVAVAALATAADALPPQDAVIGAGAVTFPDWPPGTSTTEVSAVSAHAGPQGEDGYGTIVLKSPLGDLRAEVTCLDVEGETAVVGGTIVSGTYYPGETVYPRIAFKIHDGGTGGANDGSTGLIFMTPWPDPCARLVAVSGSYSGLPPLPLEWGAFRVIDAQ